MCDNEGLDSLTQFVSDAIKHLDDLDTRLMSICEYTKPTPLSRGMQDEFSNTQSVTSSSSLGSTDLSTVQDIMWDDFEEEFKEDPVAATEKLINFIRFHLYNRATTKKFIEKANSQYVDTSFQRVSTQLTAHVNQAYMTNHNQIEEEIMGINQQLDSMKEQMSREFTDIKNIIAEIKQQKLEQERQNNKLAAFQDQKNTTIMNDLVKRPMLNQSMGRTNNQISRMSSTAVQKSLNLAIEIKKIK